MSTGFAIAFAALVVIVGLVFWASRQGAKAQQLKQAKADAAAREIADQIDGDIGALPPMAAREELRKWSSD